jgi:hypothetical protein
MSTRHKAPTSVSLPRASARTVTIQSPAAGGGGGQACGMVFIQRGGGLVGGGFM